MSDTRDGDGNPWLQPAAANVDFVRTFLQVASSLATISVAHALIPHMSLPDQIATDLALTLRQEAENGLTVMATMMMCSSASSAAFFSRPKTSAEYLPKTAGVYSYEATNQTADAKKLQGEAKEKEAMLETLDAMIDQAVKGIISRSDAFNETLQQVNEVMESAEILSAAKISA